MKRSMLIGIVLLVLLFITGCQGMRKYAQITQEQGISAPYLKTFEKWTKTNALYSGFETRMLVQATYKSKEFLDAYAAEYARLYDLPKQVAGAREMTMPSGDGGYEFVFYAYTPVKGGDDFERTKPSWNIYLFVGEERLLPLEIKRTNPITPNMRIFYPYSHSQYGNFYSVKFPAAKSHSVLLSLVFVGPLGRLELAW